MRILLTGATGFLGSHIAEELLNQQHEVIALKRRESNISKCSEFASKIEWIESDDISSVANQIISAKPDVLIHSAWGGVKASDRDDWFIQEQNLAYLTNLLNIVSKTGIKRIIGIGSQAEYGNFEGKINEKHPCLPNSAYGANKVCASVLLKAFSEQHGINWFWIRIFSVFGPREDKNWLIPATINNLLTNSEMNLTPCQQKYDYLYVKDFSKGISKIIYHDAPSGVFNMSANKSYKLIDILTYLEKILSPNKKLLKIGATDYRPHQIMHMEGDSNLFYKLFDFYPDFSIYEGLDRTIKYYQNLQ